MFTANVSNKSRYFGCLNNLFFNKPVLCDNAIFFSRYLNREVCSRIGNEKISKNKRVISGGLKITEFVLNKCTFPY